MSLLRPFSDPFNRRRVAVLRSLFGGTLAAVMLICLGLVVLPADAAPSTACKDFYFLSARGSGEKFAKPTATASGGTTIDGSPETQAVLDGMLTAYSAAGRTPSYEVTNLKYPARDVWPMLIAIGTYLSTAKSNPIVAGVTLTNAQRVVADYLDGERQAESGFRSEMDRIHAACAGTGRTPAIVLAGYSQGAMAVHNVLTTATRPNEIAGAVLIADPERLPLSKVKNLGNADNTDPNSYGLCSLLARIPVKGRPSCLPDYKPVPEVPGSLLSRTTQVCNDADAVCDTGRSTRITDPWGNIERLSAGYQTHTRCRAYCSGTTRLAGNQLARRLITATSPIPTPPSNTPPTSTPPPAPGSAVTATGVDPGPPGLRIVSPGVVGRDRFLYFAASWTCTGCATSPAQGLVGVDPTTRRTVHAWPLTDPAVSVQSGSALRPAVDGQGGVWIGVESGNARGGGLARFAPDGTVARYDLPGVADRLDQPQVVGLAGLPDGSLWIFVNAWAPRPAAYRVQANGRIDPVVLSSAAYFAWNSVTAADGTTWAMAYDGPRVVLASLNADGSSRTYDVPDWAKTPCRGWTTTGIPSETLGFTSNGRLLLSSVASPRNDDGCIGHGGTVDLSTMSFDPAAYAPWSRGAFGRDGRFWFGNVNNCDYRADIACGLNRWDPTTDTITTDPVPEPSGALVLADDSSLWAAPSVTGTGSLARYAGDSGSG